jgi:hypothetical protein
MIAHLQDYYKNYSHDFSISNDSCVKAHMMIVNISKVIFASEKLAVLLSNRFATRGKTHSDKSSFITVWIE